MGTFVWLYSPRTNSPHLTMNSFVVLSTLLAAACAAPQLVNQGPTTGPLTPVVGGDLVATPKGFRSIALEGFSEDLNEDGFVDPIAPAAPAPIGFPHTRCHPPNCCSLPPSSPCFCRTHRPQCGQPSPRCCCTPTSHPLRPCCTSPSCCTCRYTLLPPYL